METYPCHAEQSYSQVKMGEKERGNRRCFLTSLDEGESEMASSAEDAVISAGTCGVCEERCNRDTPTYSAQENAQGKTEMWAEKVDE